MPSEIIADSQATSPGIRRHAVLALDVPPEAQESVARHFQAARHDATKLTKALPERAPPTSKGCRRLAASSRLAEQCSAVSSGDSALPAHEFFGLGLGERTR
jgi:flavin reductase (DIM6/NTAB) family NADH-FMN oxidoreductase RutF